MKKGFTLVELSIVLVIIGLLTGGILVAQSLITSVKINRTISTIQQMDSAAILYKEQFRYLPGDNPNDPPQDGLDAQTGGCFGDGTIDTGCDYWPKAGTHFMGGIRQFFQIVSSRTFSPDPTNYNNTVYNRGADFLSAGQFQTTYPAPIARGGNDVGFWVSCTVNGGFNCLSSLKENYYSIVQAYRYPGGGNSFAVPVGINNAQLGKGATVKPADLLSIDLKFDDGVPNRGYVRSGRNPDTQIGVPSRLYVNDECTNVAGNTYLVDEGDYLCFPLIRVGSIVGGL